MWATLIFCGTTALFLSMTLAALWHLRWVRRLPALEALTTATGRALSSPSERVRCSVVIAARDEETRIEGTVRRLMAQRGVEAEFFIVDDRSTDRTGEILRQLAKEDFGRNPAPTGERGCAGEIEAGGSVAGRLAGQVPCLPRRRQRGHRRLDSFHGCRLLVEAGRDRAGRAVSRTRWSRTCGDFSRDGSEKHRHTGVAPPVSDEHFALVLRGES